MDDYASDRKAAVSGLRSNTAREAAPAADDLEAARVMRNISFALTTRQILEQSKTVTRRTGWAFLRPGEILQAIEKGQGLKKGEHVRRLGAIQILDVRRERPRRMYDDPEYGALEVVAEGFPDFTPAQFVELLCLANNITPDTMITRIEFTYHIEGGDRVASSTTSRARSHATNRIRESDLRNPRRQRRREE